MCSISGHWLGGLRGSWASRSPSLEADARAVLALITGRLRERARYRCRPPIQREGRTAGGRRKGGVRLQELGGSTVSTPEPNALTPVHVLPGSHRSDLYPRVHQITPASTCTRRPQSATTRTPSDCSFEFAVAFAIITRAYTLYFSCSLLSWERSPPFPKAHRFDYARWHTIDRIEVVQSGEAENRQT